MLYNVMSFYTQQVACYWKSKITECSNHNQLEHWVQIMAKFLSEPKLVTDNYPSSSFMQEPTEKLLKSLLNVLWESQCKLFISTRSMSASSHISSSALCFLRYEWRLPLAMKGITMYGACSADRYRGYPLHGDAQTSSFWDTPSEYLQHHSDQENLMKVRGKRLSLNNVHS